MKPENRPKIKFEGREYDDYQATQKQRQIERTIRKQKRRKAAFEAAGLTEDAQAANIRLKRLNKEYREFSKKAGLPEQRERMRVLYPDGSAIKSVTKSLEKQAKSGIIEANMPKEIPGVRKEGIPRRPLTSVDVTEEYIKTATPGHGSITYEAGYQTKNHQAEIDMAQRLYQMFGGDIKLLSEAIDRGIKTPDYLWNGGKWELKGTHSVSGADKRLQYAIKQIKDNPGGVILDILEDLDMQTLERQILGRFLRSDGIDTLDVMLLSKGDFLKVLRHKK